MNAATNWKDQLSSRGQYSLSQNEKMGKSDHLFLSSPSDWGVMRNGGKNGARFAPEVLLSNFKKMALHTEDKPWSHHIVANACEEEKDFCHAQLQSAQSIKEIIDQSSSLKTIIHLGAGHDHVYPLGHALMEQHKNILIINIDAHLDTRMDKIPHSGTPFRQLYQDSQKSEAKRITLAQVGIHSYANVDTNYEGMDQMNILAMEDIKSDKDLRSWLDKVLAFNQGPLILSLDCDGLDGSIMPAVSAANHHGLNKHQMNLILEASLNYWNKYQHPRIFGLYEYNPLFDDLHTTSGRYLASLIHKVYSHA